MSRTTPPMPLLSSTTTRLLKALFASADAYARAQRAEVAAAQAWQNSGKAFHSKHQRAYEVARDRMLNRRREVASRALRAAGHPELRRLFSLPEAEKVPARRGPSARLPPGH